MINKCQHITTMLWTSVLVCTHHGLISLSFHFFLYNVIHSERGVMSLKCYIGISFNMQAMGKWKLCSLISSWHMHVYIYVHVYKPEITRNKASNSFLFWPGPHIVAQVHLELMTLCLEGWYYRWMPPWPASVNFQLSMSTSSNRKESLGLGSQTASESSSSRWSERSYLKRHNREFLGKHGCHPLASTSTTWMGNIQYGSH